MPAEIMDKRLLDLHAQCRELGHLLTRQGKAALEGCPPDELLLEDARSFKALFDSTRETIMQLYQKYNLNVTALQPIGNTAQLTQLWDNIKPLLNAEQQADSTTMVPTAHSADEAAILLALIESLIKAGRLTPAFWLSAYYELLYTDKPPLPPVWLKMIEISRLITEQHRQAVQALARFYEETAQTCREEPLWQWLAFSAALLPGFHVPSSGARRVLQDLDTLPRPLKNLISLLFKSHPADARLDPPAQEARHWLETNRQIDELTSPLAIRLWESMMEEHGLICRLLLPIAEKDQAERETVSKMLKSLEKEAFQHKELAVQYRNLLKKYRINLKNQEDSDLDAFQISGSAVILNRLQEALKLSGRWLDTLDTLDGYDDAPDGTDDEKGGVPAEKLHAAVDEAASWLQSFAAQQLDGNLSLVLTLAGQTLDHLKDSLSNRENQAKQEMGRLAACHSDMLLEAGSLPDPQAVTRIGQAVFNYFRADMERSGPQRQHDSLTGKEQRMPEMPVAENPGTAQYFSHLVSVQKEDFSENM